MDVVSGERGACASCRFHRVGTSTARQIDALTPDYARTAAQPGLEEMLRSDRELRAADEAQLALVADSPAFGHRPTGIAYCGAHETGRRYENLLVKNPDGRSCGDWAPPATDGSGSCRTCAHRVAPTSGEYDRTASVLGEIAAEKAIATKIEKQWKELRSAISTSAKWELREAYDTLGRFGRRPSHVPWCRALSDDPDGPFVLGDVVNVGKSCPHWVDGGSPSGPSEADHAWSGLEQARSALSAERERRRAQSTDYNALHVDDLLHLQHDYHEAAGAYLRISLRELGVTRTEADEAVLQLLSTLHSHYPSPRSRRPTRVVTTAAPAPEPVAAAPAAPSTPSTSDGRSRKRRGGGLLDALFGLSAPDASAEPSAAGTTTPSPPAPTPTPPPSAPPPRAPEPEAPALREHMDPPADGGMAVTGEHRHPRTPTVGVVMLGRDAQQVHTSLFRLERVGGTALTERFDLSIVLTRDGPYQHLLTYVDGSARGYFTPGRWHDATVLLGRPFPVRIGFGFEKVKRSERVGIWLQWLEDPR